MSTIVVETEANEEKKVIHDLRPYSHYDLAVAVFNSKGEGPGSEMLSFQTHEGGEPETGTGNVGCWIFSVVILPPRVYFYW